MKPIQRIGAIAMAGVALAVTSCATGGRSPSGFLGHFSQMDGGYGTADAVSSYVKPGVDLQKYDSVILDPVTTVIATPGISPAVESQLAAYLGSSLRTQMAGRMPVVGAAGPRTLRVRVALTDVLEGKQAKGAVTTVHTDPKVTLTGKLESPSVAAFISQVSFEGEMLDSVTGERLHALCDHRLGAKREATVATPWAAVRSAVDQGASRLSQRFLAARKQ